MNLTPRAIESLDRMVLGGLQAGLTGRDCGLESSQVVPDLADMKDTRAVMLSVAMVECRMVLFIYFSHDNATRNHLAIMQGKAPQALDGQAFLDGMSECGNIACGTLNRDLGQVFTHLGMSTPAVVDSECARHLGILRHAHQRHYVLALQTQVRFHATLCICPYVPLDFNVTPHTETASSGELELF